MDLNETMRHDNAEQQGRALLGFAEIGFEGRENSSILKRALRPRIMMAGAGLQNPTILTPSHTSSSDSQPIGSLI